MCRKYLKPVLLLVLIFLVANNISAQENIKTEMKQEKLKNKSEIADTIKVIMHTNFGDVTLELYPEKAPMTVENFITYVNDDFYDGLIFHRIIPNFMIQGGGFDMAGKQKEPTHDPIKNEATNGLKNERGTIAMARTTNPHSATCQFFINVKDNTFLNHKNKGRGYGYAVFGKVIDGLDVVSKIEVLPTGVNRTMGMKDWPEEKVIIENVEIVE